MGAVPNRGEQGAILDLVIDDGRACERVPRLVTRLLQVPAAAVSFLVRGELHVIGALGSQILSWPAEATLCTHVLESGEPLVLEDAREHAQMRTHPAVLEHGARGYCGVPVLDPAGRAVGAVCAVDTRPRTWTAEDVELLEELARSVSSELQLRAAARELERERRHAERLARVVSGARDPVLVVDRQGVCIGWNYGAEHLYGWKAEDVLATRLELLRVGDQDGSLPGGMERLLSGERVKLEALPRRCRDGRIVLVDIDAAPLRDEHGHIVGATSIGRDVTERRQLEQELARSELRHRVLVSSLPDTMVAVYDSELRCTLLEGPLVGALGIDAAAYLGRTIGDFLAPEQVQRLEPALRRALAGDQLELDYSGQNERDYVVDVAPYREDDQEICGAFTVWRDVTVRRAREGERRRLATIVEESHDAILVKDLEGTILEWNGGAERMYGYSAAEAVGQPVAMLLPDDRAGEDRQLLERVCAGRPVSGLRTQRRRRDGRIIDVSVTISPVHDAHGEIVGAASIARDNTESESMRRELEATTARLHAVVEHSPTAIYMRDLEGRFWLANRRTAEILGSTPEELVGRRLEELLPEGLAAEVRGQDRQVLSEGQPLRLEEQVPDRSDAGRIHTYLTMKFPVTSADGEALGVGGISLDITDRVATEIALREAEAQLRVTVEHAPMGVALVDLEDGARGHVLSANPAFAELIGDECPVDYGLSLFSLVHPEDVGALERDLHLLASTDTARIELEVRCLHGNGRIVWLLLVGAKLPGPQGAGRAVLHATDIEERKRFEGQLQYLADHDALTGLYNRRRFEVELERAVAHAVRYGDHASVLLIDLDGFKYVNDTMGHPRGDELVTRVGELLRSTLRETDVVARLGGDEFAVIASRTDAQEGAVVAHKVLEALRERAVILSEDRHARVSGSIGLTTFTGGSAVTAEELLVEADIAMYQAKEAGKNQVSVFEREGDDRVRTSLRRSWLERLRIAVEEERFELLAQPIRGLCAPDAERYELLLRMRGDDGELVPPATFLPNAERFGLIGRIDRWVFAQALELLRRHGAAGHDISLSINMSGKTLVEPDLLDDLQRMIDTCPVAPQRLVVEVTETAAIVNIEKARQVARRLRELGCEFALDDFGAGFASFYYLKHLDFDYLKIDGEFIRTLGVNRTDELVVKSVVDIARGLGARTIAEFVGDEETVERLKHLGVDYGQGYHLGRPGPLELALPALH
ncbi:MAG TPA: PAS domain S-box protein [Solirubrobacteraceae bacterium]|nr:PAS domain S-box protein [Solirubrobacteraceae bacterium]